MNTEPVVCKYCKKNPKVIVIGGDLFYVQCHCGKWGPYEFLGHTKTQAIKNWNDYNKPATQKEKKYD